MSNIIKWGTDPKVMRVSGFALLLLRRGICVSNVVTIVQYEKKVDTAPNDTNRLITGCLRPTPIDKLQILSGIAPPEARNSS